MVIGVPDVIEYVRTVMVAKTVALPKTEEMSGLSTDKESSVKYVTLWLQRLCEEDDEDEVASWLEAILKAGFRSKSRLRLMVSVEQLVALGVNWVAATLLVEQAQALHGALVGAGPQAFASVQAMGMPASRVWEGVLEGFPKGRSGSGGMSLPEKSLMMPALRKAIYKVAAHSEDMGWRCSKVVAETSMDDEEFAKLESEANASENIKLAGLLASSMDGGSLEYVESVAGPGAGGLTIFRTLVGAYSTLGKEGIKALTSEVMAKAGPVHRRDASMALAAWKRAQRELQARSQSPSDSQLEESLIRISKNWEINAWLQTKAEVAEQLDKQWGWEEVLAALQAKAADWVNLPKPAANQAVDGGRRVMGPCWAYTVKGCACNKGASCRFKHEAGKEDSRDRSTMAPCAKGAQCPGPAKCPMRHGKFPISYHVDSWRRVPPIVPSFVPPLPLAKSVDCAIVSEGSEPVFGVSIGEGDVDDTRGLNDGDVGHGCGNVHGDDSNHDTKNTTLVSSLAKTGAPTELGLSASACEPSVGPTRAKEAEGFEGHGFEVDGSNPGFSGSKPILGTRECPDGNSDVTDRSRGSNMTLNDPNTKNFGFEKLGACPKELSDFRKSEPVSDTKECPDDDSDVADRSGGSMLVLDDPKLKKIFSSKSWPGAIRV